MPTEKDFLGRKARPIRKKKSDKGTKPKVTKLRKAKVQALEEEKENLIKEEVVKEEVVVASLPVEKQPLTINDEEEEEDFSMLQGATSAKVTLRVGIKTAAFGKTFHNNRPVILYDKKAIKEALYDGSFLVELLK